MMKKSSRGTLHKWQFLSKKKSTVFDALITPVDQYCTSALFRAENLLIGFLSESLIFGELPERFAHIAHFW